MLRVTEILGRVLESLDVGRRQAALHRLWRSWDQVVGPETAAIAKPLGAKGAELLLGVEDSMLMQDMVHYGPAVVEQANAFLDAKVFDKVRVELIGGRVPLDEGLGPIQGGGQAAMEMPKDVGGLMQSFPADSVFGRCYRAYVRLARGAGGNDIP